MEIATNSIQLIIQKRMYSQTFKLRRKTKLSSKSKETDRINQSLRLLFALIFSVLFSYNLFSAPIAGKNRPFVVVIDPGHGGKDPGAVSKGIQEKDVVLAIGLKLGKYINESFPDVKVIFTRSTDVFVPLIDRSKIANKNKADLFISLHANTCGSSSISGTETFVLGLHKTNENLDVAKKENSVILLEDNYKSTYENFDPNSSESYIMFELVQDTYLDQSLSFAGDIQRQFRNKLDNPNRGVKQAGFLVLRQSSMPSVLVETGFVSNLSDANKLKSEEGQQEIAHSVLEAFRRFKAKNSGSAVITQPVDHAPIIKDSSNNKVLAETQKEIEPLQGQETNSTKKDTITKTAVVQNMDKTVSQSNTLEKNKISEYYSIQIGASTTMVEPTSANFKGIKNVRREKSDNYYRYYVGHEDTLEKLKPLLDQIKVKYPQAFFVSFLNGKRTIIK